jgi:hypothetical protein
MRQIVSFGSAVGENHDSSDLGSLSHLMEHRRHNPKQQIHYEDILLGSGH